MGIDAGSSAAEPESGYPRLEQQIRWYDTKSAAAQCCYKWTKIATFVCGGLVPMTATLSAELTAGLGLDGLEPGEWRELSATELAELRRAVGL